MYFLIYLFICGKDGKISHKKKNWTLFHNASEAAAQCGIFPNHPPLFYGLQASKWSDMLEKL